MSLRLHRTARALIVILAVLCDLFSVTSSAATGTLMPTPFQTVLDTNGNPISGAKVCTYLAGTTTPTATYTDSALSVANANPIVTDSAGRFTAYLSPGASYKFIYQDSTGTAATCNGVVLKTVDNVSAVPSSASNLDITGTAGEALTAGQAVYLSDGSGSKTPGSWYKADSAQIYSSVSPQIGMVPASITSGSTGTIRIGGQMTGLSVTNGTDYYIGTAGAITSTAPQQARKIGRTDSVSTLVLGLPFVPIQPWVDDFRLTLTTATPVTTADVTAATTLYYSPMFGNRLDLPDSNGNPTRVTPAEFSIAIPATTSQMYDVFAYNNAGVATLELLAWTNDTTRATAIVRTNGRLGKSGDPTRLYVGSVRTTTVSGQTEDSFAKRFVWNYYNRVQRLFRVTEATDSWTYSTATYRQANASTANQVAVVIGVAEVAIDLRVFASAQNSGGANVYVSIGEDSTTTPVAGTLGQSTAAGNAAAYAMATAQLVKYPAVGYHFYAWLEKNSGGTGTWFGDNADATLTQSGLHGVIQG